MDKNATKAQRNYLNDLLIFHGDTPLPHDQPLDRGSASEQISDLTRKRNAILPPQLPTLNAVHVAHCYAVPVGSEERLSMADFCTKVVSEQHTNETCAAMAVEYIQQVVDDMEQGVREREYATPSQSKILAGMVREQPAIAEKHGFAGLVNQGDPILKPQAMLFIEKAAQDGVSVKEIGILNRRHENEQAQERSVQAEERRREESARAR